MVSYVKWKLQDPNPNSDLASSKVKRPLRLRSRESNSNGAFPLISVCAATTGLSDQIPCGRRCGNQPGPPPKMFHLEQKHVLECLKCLQSFGTAKVVDSQHFHHYLRETCLRKHRSLHIEAWLSHVVGGDVFPAFSQD